MVNNQHHAFGDGKLKFSEAAVYEKGMDIITSRYIT
jgi:hypothetical protein